MRSTLKTSLMAAMMGMSGAELQAADYKMACR